MSECVRAASWLMVAMTTHYWVLKEVILPPILFEEEHVVVLTWPRAVDINHQLMVFKFPLWRERGQSLGQPQCYRHHTIHCLY